MAPEVNLFFRREDLAATGALRHHVSATCANRGWIYHARLVSTKRNKCGRPISLVARDVAAGLYPRLHRERVAVLVVGPDPRVPLLPDEGDALKFGRLVPLRRFVDYKSCWLRLPKDPTNDSWIGTFAGWCETTACEGEHDPRCLPFHVFTGRGRNLHYDAERRAFDSRYGPGSDRTDDRGSRWVLNPRDFHGTEALTIAGYGLRRGFHWDASAEEWRIYMPTGEWVVRGHINVYPDAHLRPKGGNVRRLN